MIRFAEQLPLLDRKLEAAWAALSEFSPPPPGVAGEVVVGLRDFSEHYKKFESPLWNECLRLRGVVGARIGINVLRKELTPLMNDLMIKNGEKRPKCLTKHPKVGSCMMRIEEFLFWYELVGEKTRMGEAVRKCYPSSGIVCDWDEGSGVISLYHEAVLHD